MLNYLVVPALVANVVVFGCLNHERIMVYVTGLRMKRQIQAFRLAGLL